MSLELVPNLWVRSVRLLSQLPAGCSIVYDSHGHLLVLILLFSSRTVLLKIPRVGKQLPEDSGREKKAKPNHHGVKTGAEVRRMLDKQSRGRKGVLREGVWKPELSEKAYLF